jgi:U2 small nuclear ribonucleoprotein B''
MILKHHTKHPSLYVSQLNDKIKKDDLRRELYMLFSTYGPILDIVAMKTAKMRGQAHIVFRDTATATQALRHLQDFEFFGKPIKVQYAKSKSEFISKLDGSYKMPTVEGGTTTAGATNGETGTALQQSIFSGAPGAVPPSTAQTAGTKRTREEEKDEDSDASMEEEDDAEMDMDESDDD